jgi:hypothetical protein
VLSREEIIENAFALDGYSVSSLRSSKRNFGAVSISVDHREQLALNKLSILSNPIR